MKRIIDLETFPRRSHYEFFKSYAYPYMGITANVDVTNLYNSAKEVGGSPFLAFLWAAANAANSVPELRQRIVNDQIVEYDHCDTAHTVALPDGTFVNCRTDCRRSFAAFQTYGRQCQEEAKHRHGFVQPGDDETELIFVSCTPWISFTQVIQPTPNPADSNVRIVFGKFFDQNGRKMLPVNIQCNHALVDGLHVGQFFQKFQELADSDLFAVPPDPSTDYRKYPTFAPLREGTLSAKQQPVPAQETPAPAPEQKAEKKERPVPTPGNAAWKNNVLRSDTLSDRISPDEWKEQMIFGLGLRREQIKSVTFLDTLWQIPADARDVSVKRNNSVLAWARPNGRLYDLYIGAKGGVQTVMDCQKMFAGYVNMERISFGCALHTENVKDMSGMFWGCSSLTELDLSGFDTSEVQNMQGMFKECTSLTKLNLSSFDTSAVQNMQGMFKGCTSLTKLDLSSFDTSVVLDMRWMFDACTSLNELNLSSFETAQVQNMGWMFSDCRSLTELDLSSFDASGAREMIGMFYNCESLSSLDLSGFKTTRAANTSAMFDRCPAGSKWQHLLH